VRVELPVSGGWVEIAERWKGTLHGIVSGAVMIQTGDDGKVLIPGDIGDRQTLAFLKQQITDWSFAQPPPDGQGIPIPKVPGPGGQDRTSVLEEVLEGTVDEDDFSVLKDAVQPLLVKLNGRGRGNPPGRPELSASS
jgi:hypothetical protein